MATLLQRRAVDNLLESAGTSVSAAMREAGYAPATAKNPKELTSSKGWHELLDEVLPDHLLTKVHLEGLAATKIVTSPTEPDITEPDFAVRHKYMETAYKLKDKYPDVRKKLELTGKVTFENFLEDESEG